MEYFRADC